ncbi:MAG: pyridoxal-phosphate dependent enzyme [Candidatus Thorarchaeota archaeon]
MTASWKRLVGNTTFTESRNMANKIGCERLFLKFEGNNPTGTQKDRIALALSEHAKSQGFQDITAGTCGNLGAALAHAANYYGLTARIFLPKGYHVHKPRIKLMEELGAKLYYVDGHYEDTIEYSADCSKDNNWFNANPGMNGTSELSINAYTGIALEIYRRLRRAPDCVICPVGNGTTIAGIYKGFKDLFESHKIPHIPRMIAVSTRRGNPIIKSFKMKSRTILDLNPNEIAETKVNEPLTNWHAFDGQEALDAIYGSNGFADYASDGKMIEFAKLVKQDEGLNVLPASASTLAVLSSIAKEGFAIKGTYVAILTGRNG